MTDRTCGRGPRVFRDLAPGDGAATVFMAVRFGSVPLSGTSPEFPAIPESPTVPQLPLQGFFSPGDGDADAVAIIVSYSAYPALSDDYLQ